MAVILFTVKRQFATVYLDDIAVFLKTPEKHIDHIPHVLTLPNNAEVTLKIKKGKFSTDKINYLGYDIRPRRLEIAGHTTEAIGGLQPPMSTTKLRSIQGLCKVFRRLVPNFARLASPLNMHLQKYQPATFATLK